MPAMLTPVLYIGGIQDRSHAPGAVTATVTPHYPQTHAVTRKADHRESAKSIAGHIHVSRLVLHRLGNWLHGDRHVAIAGLNFLGWLKMLTGFHHPAGHTIDRLP